MKKRILYRETVPAYGMILIFLAIAFWMGFNLYYQINHGPISSRPAPNTVYVVGAVFALLIGLNFSAIRIRLTDVDVRVSYGLFSKTLAWRAVASCEIDSGSALRYGGWGIRLGSIRGKRVWVYNTFRGARVAFLTGDGKSSGMVVTTRNPEGLMRVSIERISVHFG